MHRNSHASIRLRFFLLCSACVIGQFLVGVSAHAKGQGPIAAWPASERYVLLADKAYPGVVLVDLDLGITVERLEIEESQPKGIASCANCDFIFVSGAAGDYWLVHLKDSVKVSLERDGALGLADARIEKLSISTADTTLTDGRMLEVSEDGKTAFVASSDDHAVYRVEFGATPLATEFFKSDEFEPFGINWDKNGQLLVTMHKRYVLRFSLDGKRLAQYDSKLANCPGSRSFRPNLRASKDDPLHPDSILILASNPRSYDAVLWRLTQNEYGRQTCVSVVSKIGRDSGWVDTSGEDVIFSRPHYFTLRPNSDPPQAIITDIDNRALRLVNLETTESTTVMYDRDVRLSSLPPDGLTSTANCDKLAWPDARAAITPFRQTSCARPAKKDALQLTFAEAELHCATEGARLCEPSELRSSGVAATATAWTRADCASCWLRKAKGVCAADIVTFKTTGGVHNDEEFAQSWNSGQALEVHDSPTDGPATLCRPVTDELRAAAPCCADSVPHVVLPPADTAAAEPQ